MVELVGNDFYGKEMIMAAMRDKKPGFDSEFTGDVLKIKLRGELDHHSAVAIRTQIDDMIRSKRPKTLNIDMSVIDFMDSSGLGLIMGRYAVMKDIGGEMCVCDPSVRVQKIMSLAGMERMVNISYSNGNQGTSGQAVKRAAPRKRGVR